MAASAYITLTARDAVTPTLKKIQGEMEAMARNVRNFGSNFASLATFGFGAGAALGIYEVGKASIEAQMQLERLDKSFTAIYGSAATARQQLEFVRETSTAMGQEFYSAADAARTFFAAGQGTTLSGQLNEIYAGFSKAGAALGLSSDDMQGIFLALGQSMSKFKVQAEELRGQIGERLPGAFQVAAKAMGVSTAELDKMMADGELLAEDLLPRMAEVLEQQYGAAAESAADTVQGAVNRMSTAWTDFKAGILDSEPVVNALNAITEALNGINAAMGAKEAGEDLTKRMLADEGYRSHRSWYERDGTLWGVFSKREMVYDFTEKQKADYAGYEKSQAAVDKYIKEMEAREEKVLGNFRSAAAELAKKTYEGQAKALKELRDDRIKAAREAASLLADPGEADKLIAEANAQYQRDMAALDKRFSGPKSAGQKIQEKVQRQVAGFAEDTRQLLAQVESLRQSLDAAGGNLDSVEMAQAKAEAGLAKKMASNSWQAVAQADPLAYERRIALEREKIQLESRQKIAEIEKDFLDDARETLNGGYEQERAALDAKYELYKKHVTDKSLVDQWYEKERRKIDKGGFAGIQRAADDMLESSTDWAEQMGGLYTSTMDGLIDSTMRWVNGSKNAFADVANSFANMLLKMALQASMTGIGQSILGGLGGMFGGTYSGGQVATMESNGMRFSGGNSGWLNGVHGHHRGGIVGISAPSFTRSLPAAAFYGAPRFHAGGGLFGPGEYPAVLLRGERVLNRDETAAYHAGMSAGGGRVVVNNKVYNYSSAVVEQEQRPNGSGGIDVVTIIRQAKQAFAEDLARRGGKSNGVMRKQYGMDTRPVLRGD
ncbi:tape measure protein [Desulfovibrio piger]|uniref:tape measure protein n=1 Tax=Desulfovibrio piger TaxID=901 RepID=UPI0026EBDD18|nr:tape measure protein [Desulfovibrio piger]